MSLKIVKTLNAGPLSVKSRWSLRSCKVRRQSTRPAGPTTFCLPKLKSGWARTRNDRDELKEDGFTVSISQLCRWFGTPGRTVHYKPTKAALKVNPSLADPIKARIEESSLFGYRTGADLLGMNKSTVLHIFQLKGWQVKKCHWSLAMYSGVTVGDQSPE